VSLAEGSINEGYVLGGYWGVLFGVAFNFMILLLTVKMLRSQHAFLVTMGLALIASPILFERGILGGMERIGKDLQVVVLVYVITIAVAEYRRRSAPAPDICSSDLGARSRAGPG
jgi:hypothetical protein